MSWIPAAINAAAQIGGSILGRSRGSAPQAPAYEPIDIGELDEMVRQLSRRNIQEGLDLERQYRPELAGLRGQVDRSMAGSLLDSQARTGELGLLRDRIMQDMMSPDQLLEMPDLERSQLMDAASQQAMADLEMGGMLPREIQNLVTRAAMSGAGDRLGTQSGRDIVARDLGLTGLDLRNQRLGTAAQLGQFETQVAQGQQALRDSINRANQQLLAGRRQERTSGLGFLEDLGFRDRQAAAGLTMGTQTPVIGLDPGSIVDLTMADRQAQAQSQQQQAAIAAQQQAARNQQRSSMFGNVLGSLGELGGSIWESRQQSQQ